MGELQCSRLKDGGNSASDIFRLLTRTRHARANPSLWNSSFALMIRECQLDHCISAPKGASDRRSDTLGRTCPVAGAVASSRSTLQRPRCRRRSEASDRSADGDLAKKGWTSSEAWKSNASRIAT